MLGRRDFLRTGALLAAGTAATSAFANIPRFAPTATLKEIALASAQAARTLSFDNLHTGEKATISYFENGAYIPDALTAINHLLRDFRNNEVHSIEPRLLDLLFKLHLNVGSNAPFGVISGYRSPATNLMLREHTEGVAKQSLHMQGMAIDIHLADRSLGDLNCAAVALRLGGVGYYPNSDFIHVDVGPVRYW
jgi:uncharacterized protein YcbK (DUF882 family)